MVDLKGTFGSFSVNDIAAAHQFYGGVLGLKTELVTEKGPLFLHGPSGRTTLIYPKSDHTPADFTVLNLSIGDIEAAVDELVANGVGFESYDGIETDERGIARGPGHSIAWFTDPAGNVVSIVEESASTNASSD